MNVDVLKFVTENIILISIAFVSGAMLLWPLLRQGSTGASVGTLEATQLINREDALVVDVRTADEFRNGHIVRARNLPLTEFESRLPELEKFRERPLIMACESGSRSATAAAALRKRGFARVFNLGGGLGAWQQAGLPLEK